MNKSANIVKLSILSVLALILIGLFIVLLTSDIKFNFTTKSNSKLVFDNNITEEFNKIDIDTKSMDIKFEQSSDDTVNIKVYDKDDKNLSVKVEDETLQISSTGKNVCVFFCFINKKEIVISLPQKYYDLIVNSQSGDITSKIDFNNVNISTKSGDINFNKIDSADIKVISGDIDIKEVNSLNCDSKSGDLTIKNINNYIKAETTSGDIRIDNIKLSSDSSIKVTSGDVKIKSADENIYFNTKVTSGDVKINSNNRKAEYELNIKTTSGDIIVNN